MTKGFYYLVIGVKGVQNGFCKGDLRSTVLKKESYKKLN